MKLSFSLFLLLTGSFKVSLGAVDTYTPYASDPLADTAVADFNEAVGKDFTTLDSYYSWCNLYGCPQFNLKAGTWCDNGGAGACGNQCAALPEGANPGGGVNNVCTRYGPPTGDTGIPPTGDIESPPRADFLLKILPDIYGEEISWTLTNQENGTVEAASLENNPYDDYGHTPSEYIQNESIMSGCYDFTILDRYGDGICCAYGRGFYSIAINGVLVKMSDGEYGVSETTEFCTTDTFWRFQLDLHTDKFGNEIQWTLTNDEDHSTLVANDGHYESDSLVSFNTVILGGCYEFIIRDTYGDGICCAQGDGGYSISIGDHLLKHSNGMYLYGEITRFCTVDIMDWPSNIQPSIILSAPLI